MGEGQVRGGRWNAKRKLSVFKNCPCTREEESVQYLSALKEKQQWQKSLHSDFTPREN